MNKSKTRSKLQGTIKKAVGQTEETYKKLFKQMLAFQYGLKANVKLTDKDLDTAWKEFYPEVSTQIILFSTKEEADKAKKKQMKEKISPSLFKLMEKIKH